MLVIPAVDLLDGKCVRLKRGKREDVTVYSPDPVSMATKWTGMGAKRLHVIDLNGAFEGSPVNHEVIKKIVEACKIPVQVGGGIRTTETAEKYISLGVDKIIVGTKVLTEPALIQNFCELFPENVIASLDCRGTQLATDGWIETSSIPLDNVTTLLEDLGVKSIIYTNIERDGTLEGLDVDGIKKFLSFTKIPVILAGGVKSIEDIQKAKALEEKGVEGVIAGKAIYEGTLNLEEAFKIC